MPSTPHPAPAVALALALPFLAIACGGEGAPSQGATPAAATVSLGAPVEMRFAVKGMHCDGCEGAICGKVEKIEGVSSVKASHATESVEVVAPPEQREAIEAAIKRLGYTIEG